MNTRWLLPQVPFTSCGCWLHITYLYFVNVSYQMSFCLCCWKLPAVNNFHCSFYTTPWEKGHKYNSYSIISIAHRGVAFRYLYEEDPGCVNTQVTSGGDVEDRKMNSVMASWDIVKNTLCSQICAISALWVEDNTGRKYTAAFSAPKS